MPRRIYKDPFRMGDNIIVMCDCYEPPRVLPDGTLSEMKVRRVATGVGVKIRQKRVQHVCPVRPVPLGQGCMDPPEAWQSVAI